MINANFSTYASYVTDSLYQWDLNRTLSVSGLNLSVAPEVHFSNANMDKAIVKQAELINHVVTVQIPNSLLQDPFRIYAHIGIYEGNTFKVVEVVEIPVIPKKRPLDYKFENSDEEIYSFERLENRIANMVKISDFNTDKAAITARIDNIIAHNNDTDGNTELLDLRNDSFGFTHASAGNAVRVNIGRVKDSVDTIIDENDLTSREVFDFQSVSQHILVSQDKLYNTDCDAGISFDDVVSYNSVGARAYRIPLKDYESISFPVFKTSERFGCFVLDQSYNVIEGLCNTTLETGENVNYKVPENAGFFILSVSPSLAEKPWEFIGYRSGCVEKIKASTITGLEISKAEMSEKFNAISRDRLPHVSGSIGKHIDDARFFDLTDSVCLKIDLQHVYRLTYPVFKSTENLGSLIFDKNNKCIWGYSETENETGSYKTIDIPTEASYMILAISASLSEMDYKLMFGTIKDRLAETEKKIDNRFDGLSLLQNTENKNLCLCALKTDILSEKIPYTRGYLFHKLQNDDGSLWYGNDFDHVYKVGAVEFTPSACMLAVSPKDGRVIATKRGDRGSLFVYDGTSTVELFANTELKPMGWLYNSGVEFVKDSNGVEHCIFAEYSGNATTSSGGFNVWRGTYPYVSESNWKTVFSQNYVGDTSDNCITHFHQVRRDPWTNILYLTSGDSNALSKWWYSTDFGVTWTLLTTGETSGFEEHTCRCINFVFTKDYVYWATDHGINHSLNRIARNPNTGLLDLSTREKLADLPEGKATNSICYVDFPKGLFMYDRIDIGFTDHYDGGFDVQFYDLTSNKLSTVKHIDLNTKTWGGNRGKCYVNYTNSINPYPAIGFSIDTPCDFDMVTDDPKNIGTVCYDVSSKVLRTVNIK